MSNKKTLHISSSKPILEQVERELIWNKYSKYTYFAVIMWHVPWQIPSCALANNTLCQSLIARSPELLLNRHAENKFLLVDPHHLGSKTDSCDNTGSKSPSTNLRVKFKSPKYRSFSNSRFAQDLLLRIPRVGLKLSAQVAVKDLRFQFDEAHPLAEHVNRLNLGSRLQAWTFLGAL